MEHRSEQNGTTFFDGKMIVVTAPSGAGKTTIVRHLLRTFDFLDFSVSATTRDRRPHEREGEHYYFISHRRFRELIETNAFIEWEEVYADQFYGTLKSEVERVWDSHRHIVFDIDVEGACSIKDMYGDQCMTIFVKPPSLETLIERLKNRRTESARSLEKRIERITKELTYETRFDYVLLNDKLDDALQEAEHTVYSFIHKEVLADHANTDDEGHKN